MPFSVRRGSYRSIILETVAAAENTNCKKKSEEKMKKVVQEYNMTESTPSVHQAQSLKKTNSAPRCTFLRMSYVVSIHERHR